MKVIDQAHRPDWSLYCGDSAEVMPGLPSASVDLAVFSPPFANLYTYSASDRDLGNCTNDETFWRHYSFITREIARVMKPGRNVAVHVMQIPSLKVKDGVIGLKDFRGDMIRHFQAHGFTLHGEAVIWKNAQALRDGTPVLTPGGWVPVQDLRVNDFVIGKTGRATRVTGVFPQGERQLYRVAFSDGTSVDCDGAHLWTVRHTWNRHDEGAWQVKTTDELRAERLTQECGTRRFEIPIVDPIEYGRLDPLPLDPYLVGALIGDGCLAQEHTISLTVQHHIAERTRLPAGHSWRRLPGSDRAGGLVATYNLNGSLKKSGNEVLKATRALGLQGKRAWEKLIPEPYLFADVEARRALLQGLLDTDGKIDQHGAVRFNTTSERLADDTAFLARSLGFVVRRRVDHNRPYTYQGETRNGRPLYEVTIGMTGDWCPFTLPEKVARWKSDRRQPRREIVSIEPVDVDNATCIQVDADDQLYVTKDCIVTHNSQGIRTKSKGLLFTQLHKDSVWSRPALADYILVFRAPGENAVPIVPDLTNDEWIDWASPIWQIRTTEQDYALAHGEVSVFDVAPGVPLFWYGISESDTLNVREARSEQDERHICPLQLGTIERCVRLWSNPGEVVLTPFLGIGSEIYVARRLGRRGIGIELKREWWQCAVRNTQRADQEGVVRTLEDDAETEIAKLQKRIQVLEKRLRQPVQDAAREAVAV